MANYPKLRIGMMRVISHSDDGGFGCGEFASVGTAQPGAASRGSHRSHL